MDFQKNQPSVKLHQAPGKISQMLMCKGGQSNFSLGWGDNAQPEQPKRAQQPASQSPWATDEPSQPVQQQAKYVS